MQPERDHGFETTGSAPGQVYGRSSRRLFNGQSMQFRMARGPGPSVLSVTYWGWDMDQQLAVEVDGRRIATERRSGPRRAEWVTVDYPVPATTALHSLIRFVAIEGEPVVYGVRMILRPGTPG